MSMRFCLSCAAYGLPMRTKGHDYCNHCGAYLDPKRGLEMPIDEGTTGRLVALQLDPMYRAAMSQPHAALGGTTRAIGWCVIAAGGAGGIALAWNGLLFDRHMAVVPLVGLALWSAIGAALVVSGRRQRGAPIAALPAVIVTSRAPAGAADHVVTVEVKETRKRRDYRAAAAVADPLVSGAHGVAFLENERLIGFARLDR
jgi:hypothetical protein